MAPINVQLNLDLPQTTTRDLDIYFDQANQSDFHKVPAEVKAGNESTDNVVSSIEFDASQLNSEAYKAHTPYYLKLEAYADNGIGALQGYDMGGGKTAYDAYMHPSTVDEIDLLNFAENLSHFNVAEFVQVNGKQINQRNIVTVFAGIPAEFIPFIIGDDKQKPPIPPISKDATKFFKDTGRIVTDKKGKQFHLCKFDFNFDSYHSDPNGYKEMMLEFLTNLRSNFEGNFKGQDIKVELAKLFQNQSIVTVYNIAVSITEASKETSTLSAISPQKVLQPSGLETIDAVNFGDFIQKKAEEEAVKRKQNPNDPAVVQAIISEKYGQCLNQLPKNGEIPYSDIETVIEMGDYSYTKWHLGITAEQQSALKQILTDLQKNAYATTSTFTPSPGKSYNVDLCVVPFTPSIKITISDDSDSGKSAVIRSTYPETYGIDDPQSITDPKLKTGNLVLSDDELNLLLKDLKNSMPSKDLKAAFDKTISPAPGKKN